jgi:hypothetical protein
VAGAVVGVLALVSAAAALVSVERAVVRISVQPTAVHVAGVELTGGAAGQRLATTRLNASASESLTVPSGTSQLPATFATGLVYFWCSPMTSCPNGYAVPAGTVLGSPGGARYLTEGSTTFPSCQPSAMVAIRAETAGDPGNAGAGTVVYGQLPSFIHVTNSAPIMGGANARSVRIVLQSNIDTAGATLTTKVEGDLNAELRVQAGLLTYVPVGAPVFKVDSDNHPGDAAPTVTVTVSGALQAVAFSTKGALTMLRGLVGGSAPRGYELTSAPITATYSFDPAAGGLTASASAYVVPGIDASTMAAGLRGEGSHQAIATLQRAIPGSTVTIQTAPLAWPWLPLLADHISIREVT